MDEEQKPDNGQADNNESLDQIEDASIIVEFWEFLCENKKFWLIPILVVILILALILVFGSTGAAPFIYTLF